MTSSTLNLDVAIAMMGSNSAKPLADKFAYVTKPWTLIDDRMKCSALLKTLVTIASAISTLFVSVIFIIIHAAQNPSNAYLKAHEVGRKTTEDNSQQNKDLEKKLKKAEATIQSLNQKLKTEPSSTEDNDQEVNRIREAHKDLLKKCTTLEQEKNNYNQTIASLKIEIVELEKTLAIRRSVDGDLKTIVDLEDEHTNLNANQPDDCDFNEFISEKLFPKLYEQSAELQKCNERIKDLQSEIQKLEADTTTIATLKQKLDILSKTVREYDEQNKELEAENEQLKNDAAAAASTKPLCTIEGTENNALVISRHAYAMERLKDQQGIRLQIVKEISNLEFETVNLAILRVDDLIHAKILLLQGKLKNKIKEKMIIFWYIKGNEHLFSDKDFKGINKYSLMPIINSGLTSIQKHLPKSQ